MADMIQSAQQRRFGSDKRDRLTRQCRECEVLALCNGGCPKDRFINSSDGEPEHNYLCAGLYRFFTHTRPAMRAIAGLIQKNALAADIMPLITAEDSKRGRNDPCPCGNGRKWKQCHGRT
jgi:uncharacterized protein